MYNYDTGIHVYGGVDYGHAYNNKISAKVTGINLDVANYWTLKFNKFVDMSEVLVSAINCSGKYNKIQWNDYSESGIPGLSETTPYGPVCVYLDDDSWGNAVYEKYLPSNTQIADQVTDLGLDNKIFSPLK